MAKGYIYIMTNPALKDMVKIGYSSDRDKNRIANLTYLTYPINQLISDDAPADYVQQFKTPFGAKYDVQLERHAIPKDFENMDYKDFLKERRVLMTPIIKTGLSTIVKINNEKRGILCI